MKYESLMSGIVETGGIVLDSRTWPSKMFMFIDVFSNPYIWIELATILNSNNNQYNTTNQDTIYYRVLKKSSFPRALECTDRMIADLVPSFKSSTSILLSLDTGLFTWEFKLTENQVIIVVNGHVKLHFRKSPPIDLPSGSITFLPVSGESYIVEGRGMSMVMIFG